MKKGKATNEVDAVRTLHEVLKPLDADARLRVLQATMTLLQIGVPAAGVGPQQPAIPSGQIPGSTQPPTPLDKIDRFVSSKRPIDTYQRLVCLAYFIEHKENKVDLSAKELRKANTDARQSNISNISWFLDLATRRHGYFSAAGHGKKRLSHRGSVVVEALPDQAAVKTALLQNPLPKKGGRKRKGKKG